MNPNNRPQTRSQAPGPLTDGDASRNGAGAARTADRSPRSMVTLASGLTVLFTHEPLDASERACFRATIASPKAVREGSRVAARDVVEEYDRCVRVVAPWIDKGTLRGYGALRVAYAGEIITAMAPTLDAHAVARNDVVTATSRAAETVKLTRAERRLAVRSLRNLTGDDPALKARLREAAKQRQRGGGLNEIDRITVEVRHVRANYPARVLDDAGLSAAVLDALVAATSDASAARTRVRDGKQQAQVLRADLAEPAGRLLHELRALVAAARDTRKSDPTVPSLSSWLLRRAKKRKDEPTTPSTPTGAPR